MPYARACRSVVQRLRGAPREDGVKGWQKFYRSFIEMIPKNDDFCKLDKVEERAKRGDFGVKTQPVLHLKVSYFEEQCNLSCEAK